MEDYFAVEGDMLESEGQIDAMQEEEEHEPHISYTDFFARDNVVNMMPAVVDQSDTTYIDFFARENQLNDVPDHVVDHPVEQSHIQCIDFFAWENQLNDVPDHVVDQPVEQSHIGCIDFLARNDQMNDVADYVADERAEQSSFLYHDFFNSNNQLFYDFFNIDNQLNAAANVVEQSVQETDYYSPEGQLWAAANMGEQYIPDIDYIPLENQLNAAADVVDQSVGNDPYNLENHSRNFQYYPLENQLSAGANMVEQSVQETDYNAPEIQLSAATDVAEQPVRDIDYIATEYALRAAANVIEQYSAGDIDYIDMIDLLSVDLSGVNIILIGENGEVLNDGHSHHDEDGISEIEPFPDDDPPFDEHPASRSVVRNLASVILTQGSVERDCVACAVCQDEFNVGEMAKELPCSHYYHDDCILPWLDLQNTCPVCRYELPIDNDSDNEGEENESLS